MPLSISTVVVSFIAIVQSSYPVCFGHIPYFV
jgi:hypothetical protein